MKHMQTVIYNHVNKIKHERVMEDFVDMDKVNELYRRMHNNCEELKISPSIIFSKYDIKIPV